MHYDKNVVSVVGEVVSEVKEAYEHQGIKFSSFFVGIKRLSGVIDRLLVVAKDSVIPDGLDVGVRVAVNGGFRVYQNKFEELGTRNAYVIYSADITIVDDDVADLNEITLIGYPVNVKEARSTVSGRSLREVVIATNKYYTRHDGREHSKAYYINCIAWANSIDFFSHTEPTDYVEIKGRIQSRDFKRPGNDRVFTAYEVSITTADKYNGGEDKIRD